MTALLTIFVCFHGSEKSGSSGSERLSCRHIMFSFGKQYCLLIWLTKLRETLQPQLDGGPNCHLSIIFVSLAWIDASPLQPGSPQFQGGTQDFK